MVFRKRLTRAKVVPFFAAQALCAVALEACAGAHHWAREFGKLGHTATWRIKPTNQRRDPPDLSHVALV
jgi:transposase